MCCGFGLCCVVSCRTTCAVVACWCCWDCPLCACACVCVYNSPTELPTLEVPPVIAAIEPPSPEPQAQPLPKPQNQSEEEHRNKEEEKEEEMEGRKEEEGKLIPACTWRQEWKEREEEYERHPYNPPQRSQTLTLTHGETAIHLTGTAEQRCQSQYALTPEA